MLVTCPYCAEQIQAEAKKCKHCGEWLELSAMFNYLQQPPASQSIVSSSPDIEQPVLSAVPKSPVSAACNAREQRFEDFYVGYTCFMAMLLGVAGLLIHWFVGIFVFAMVLVLANLLKHCQSSPMRGSTISIQQAADLLAAFRIRMHLAGSVAVVCGAVLDMIYVSYFDPSNTETSKWGIVFGLLPCFSLYIWLSNIARREYLRW